MAEALSRITFGKDDSLLVAESIDQIDGIIKGVTNPVIPLIKLTDQYGRETWINANAIRTITVQQRSEPSVTTA